MDSDDRWYDQSHRKIVSYKFDLEILGLSVHSPISLFGSCLYRTVGSSYKKGLRYYKETTVRVVLGKLRLCK